VNNTELAIAIAEKDFDLDSFVALAIQDEIARGDILRLMLTHEDVMVYYHAFYVLDKLTQSYPQLLYSVWSEVVPLLKHPNSYHRNFGLVLLANLTQVDRKNRFVAVFTDYFALLNDPKFMTASCCVCNSAKIMRHQPQYRPAIIALLLDLNLLCDYPDKQKALLMADVLQILDGIYLELPDHFEVDQFILALVDSISPKTRKFAKRMARRYSIARFE
jgi:hypothetical protein